MKNVYSILLAVGVFSVLSNCSDLNATVTDDHIKTSAKESYVFRNYLSDDDIHIESKEGKVTLTGTVSEESHKSLAKETIMSLPKVRSVDDQLKVVGERPTELSDAWITTKVKTNLMFHRQVRARDTQVSTNNGVVTLKGEAMSQAQKDLTSEYAKDVDGAKEIRNEMTVEKAHTKNKKAVYRSKDEKIDDASITGQVKVALFSHSSTSAVNTKVKTTNGVVTLHGIAKNKAEKQLVSKLSYDVYGVKNVKNQMTVGNPKRN